MIEIMIVVALVGLLATIATPTWVRARTRAQTNTCINNLRQIDGAKQQWGLETKQSSTATPLFTDISGYMKHTFVCPAGGSAATFASTYEMQQIDTKPTCLIDANHFLPLDSSQ